MAPRQIHRRAISFLELTVVLAIVGLIAVTAISRFGHSTIASGSAQGVARKLALDLVYARRSTIASGDNHYLQWHSDSGDFTGYTLFRRTSGGNLPVDETRNLPQGITVQPSHAVNEFDFDGSALSGYTILVEGPHRTWTITVVGLTGSVRVTETTL